MEEARPATDADLDPVVTLARAMRAEIGPMKGGSLLLAAEARREPLDDAYRAVLAATDAELVVGCIDDVVVGFAVVEVQAIDGDAPLGVVTDLYVEPEARSVGVGEAIVSDLMAFCVDRGCVGIDARALPGDRATKNFFEGQGFTARALVMHHPLPSP